MAKAIGVTVQLRFDKAVAKVKDSVNKGAYKSLKHGLASIRLHAIASMVPAAGPSAPGTPPHAHRGGLQRSILYAVEKGATEGFVGPSYSRVKVGGRPPWMGSMHERGGVFGGGKWRKAKKTKRGRARKAAVYPARPYMGPAMDANLHRFVLGFKGSME